MLCSCTALLALACLATPAAPGGDAKQFARWEKDIAAFVKRDAAKPPPENAVLFVGSSTIRLWDLEKSFPGVPTINRGFGGSQTADVVHFAPRIVVKYKPRVIVFYSGDNDINAGKSPEQVSADFQALVDVVRKELPKTKLIVLSIKPSPSRWKLYDKMKEANRLNAAIAQKTPNVVFLNVAFLMLNSEGMPRTELYAKDGLHINADGYHQWSTALRPHLK
jgi:lysophospholipase L1-like esterase